MIFLLWYFANMLPDKREEREGNKVGKGKQESRWQ